MTHHFEHAPNCEHKGIQVPTPFFLFFLSSRHRQAQQPRLSTEAYKHDFLHHQAISQNDLKHLSREFHFFFNQATIRKRIQAAENGPRLSRTRHPADQRHLLQEAIIHKDSSSHQRHQLHQLREQSPSTTRLEQNRLDLATIQKGFKQPPKAPTSSPAQRSVSERPGLE
jgi:hypothetical protein